MVGPALVSTKHKLITDYKIQIIVVYKHPNIPFTRVACVKMKEHLVPVTSRDLIHFFWFVSTELHICIDFTQIFHLNVLTADLGINDRRLRDR